MSLRYPDGSIEPEAILAMLEELRFLRGPIINGMHDILRTYNGDVAIPLPELNTTEQGLVANLANQGIDAMGQRISSLMPDVEFASLRPGVKLADNAAKDRRSVTLGWWEGNSMRSKLARRARHYVGHGCTATVIRPDAKTEAPMWHLRSPLEAYPGETVNPDDVAPPFVIFCYSRRYSWLRSRYPAVAADFFIDGQTRPNTEIEVIEYVDAEGTELLARNVSHTVQGGYTQRKLRRLESSRYDYGGIIPATVLGRVTLGGKIMGHFDQMVPMYRMQAKLAALELVAIQKGIFPKVWFVGSNNNEPTIVQWPDPFNEKPGLVTDAQMQVEQANPTYLSGQMRADLEYAQRMTARIPAEQGGMGSVNVRTGRRGDQIISQTVDLPVQEAQDDLCRALEHENRAAIAVQKYHYGTKTYSFYVNGNKLKGRGSYNARDLFNTDEHKVKFPHSGTDVNTLGISIMQLTGSELMSKDTARKKHPLIEDAEHEKDTIVVESLTAAVLSGIQTRAASPDPAQALPITDIMRLIQLVGQDKKELPDAWEMVQREAQEREAQQMPAGDPATMPGAEVAGAGAEMAVIPEPTQSMDNLAAMFRRSIQPREPRPMVDA